MLAEMTTIDFVLVLIVENGKCLKERMIKARVDEGDIMEAARHSHRGDISIIPRNEQGVS